MFYFEILLLIPVGVLYNMCYTYHNTFLTSEFLKCKEQVSMWQFVDNFSCIRIREKAASVILCGRHWIWEHGGEPTHGPWPHGTYTSNHIKVLVFKIFFFIFKYLICEKLHFKCLLFIFTLESQGCNISTFCEFEIFFTSWYATHF